MKHEPTAYDASHGLNLSWISALPKEQRVQLARLIARTSERSYRRGFQQGAVIARDRPRDLPADLHAWRYGTSTDLAPWADCPRLETSLDRLHTENRTLAHLRLPDEFEGEPSGVRAWPHFVE